MKSTSKYKLLDTITIAAAGGFVIAKGISDLTDLVSKKIRRSSDK